MKKRTVLLVLLALLVLSGCGQGGLAARSAETAQEEADFSSTLVEGQARPLTEGEIRSAYDRAVNAYGWFDLTPLPTTSQQETVDGWLYQKVDYPGIEDLADLRAYLRVVFSQELTDRLSNHYHMVIPAVETRYLQLYFLAMQNTQSINESDRQEASELCEQLLSSWSNSWALHSQRTKTSASRSLPTCVLPSPASVTAFPTKIR